MIDKCFILSDWFANVRKCIAALNQLSDWEIAQSRTYPIDTHHRPLLFLVESQHGNDILIFETTSNKTYGVPVRKIPISQNYAPAITIKKKLSNEWADRVVIQEAIIKSVNVIKHEI